MYYSVPSFFSVHSNDCLLISSDEKLAFLMASTIISIRQAQIETTMNVKMAVMTVLSKIPKYDHNTLQEFVSEFSETTQEAKSIPKDYELHFKPVLEKVSHKF